MSTDSRNRLAQLEPRYATGMSRTVAVLIDLLPIIIVAALLPGLGEYGVLPFAIAFTVTAPYMFLWEVSIGRTPGKFLLGIRVVNHAGETPDAGAVATRNVLRIYDAAVTMAFIEFLIAWDILVRQPLPGGISGAYRFVWSERGQRWGDELANTFVVKGQWKPAPIGSRAPMRSKQGTGIRVSGESSGSTDGIRLSRRKPDC